MPARHRRTARRPTPRPTPPPRYAEQTRRPLACLLFLLPLVAAYEAALVMTHSALGEVRPGLAAPQLLERFFGLFGVTGYYLPGAALVVILLIMHLVSGHAWRVQPAVLAGMAGESLLWAMPLLGLNYLHLFAVATGGADRTWVDDLVLSIGAGIYEELLFRLMVITVLMILIVDVCGVKHLWGAGLSIAISSLLFAAHHYPPIGTDVFQPSEFLFRLIAGWYLAGVFIYRGFGIAVGAHAMYNVIVVGVLGR